MVRIKNIMTLPDCPYCGARLGYLESFVVKNRSVYRCKNCENKSETDLNKNFYNILWVILGLSVIIFVLATVIGGGFSLFGLFLIAVVAAGFYGISPYMVVLRKARIKEEKENQAKKERKELPKKEKLVQKSSENNIDFSDKDIFSS